MCVCKQPVSELFEDILAVITDHTTSSTLRQSQLIVRLLLQCDLIECVQKLWRCLFSQPSPRTYRRYLQRHVASSLWVCPYVCLSRSCILLKISRYHTISYLHTIVPCLFIPPQSFPQSDSPRWFERRRHSMANCGRMVRDSAMVTMESL